MVDLFKVPQYYPGIAEATAEDPLARVRHLEERCAEDIGDRRFFSYLQLHEFEALLLADLKVLIEQHPNRGTEIGDLAARLEREFPSPEHVFDDVGRAEHLRFPEVLAVGLVKGLDLFSGGLRRFFYNLASQPLHAQAVLHDLAEDGVVEALR